MEYFFGTQGAVRGRTAGDREGAGILDRVPSAFRGAGRGRERGVSITVGELAAMPHLQAKVVAGHDGLDNAISWAHVIDGVSDPWHWLDRGDLLITTGISMPGGSEGQHQFITELHEAGMAGLVVAPEAPALRKRLRQTADRLAFPVLSAGVGAWFAEYIRTVANANEQAEGEALGRIMLIYNELRLAIEGGREAAELLRSIGELVGIDLFVVDAGRGESLLPGCAQLDPAWREALGEEVAARGEHLPLMTRLEVNDASGMALPIPGPRNACLVVLPRSEVAPSLGILQHVGAACAFELARTEADFERRRRIGATVMSDAIEGRVDAQVLLAHLAERELDGPLVCVVFDCDGPALDRLQREWAVRGVPHLVSESEGRHIGLLSAGSESLTDLGLRARDEDFRVGVSSPFTGPTGILDAGQQARWALETVPPDSSGSATYGTSQDAFLPRTLSECEHAVHRVLGPLITYDEEHETNLVGTLKAYLECDRSPQRAAKILFVHKQTVTYRIKRIEELTSRSMRSTSDVSEMWFALRALALTMVGERAGEAPAASPAAPSL